MDLPDLSRRTFLRRSLQLAGAAATWPMLGTTGCAEDGSRIASPGEGGILGASARATLEAVAETLVPSGGPFAAGAREVELAARVERLVAEAPPELQRGFRGALLVVEWASPLLAGRLARFSTLPIDQRLVCVRALVESRLDLAREVYAGLKQICLFVFYAQDASWSSLGYDGPWIHRGGAVAGVDR
jgi:hypothetical protein